MSENKNPPRTKYIEVKGQRFGLLLDFNALCDLEDVLGKPIGELDDSNRSVKEARAIIWAALNGWVRRDRPADRPAFTINGAGNVLDDLLQERGVEGMQAALAGLGDSSFPAAATPDEAASGN